METTKRWNEEEGRGRSQLGATEGGRDGTQGRRDTGTGNPTKERSGNSKHQTTKLMQEGGEEAEVVGEEGGGEGGGGEGAEVGEEREESEK